MSFRQSKLQSPILGIQTPPRGWKKLKDVECSGDSPSTPATLPNTPTITPSRSNTNTPRIPRNSLPRVRSPHRDARDHSPISGIEEPPSPRRNEELTRLKKLSIVRNSLIRGPKNNTYPKDSPSASGAMKKNLIGLASMWSESTSTTRATAPKLSLVPNVRVDSRNTHNSRSVHSVGLTTISSRGNEFTNHLYASSISDFHRGYVTRPKVNSCDADNDRLSDVSTISLSHLHIPTSLTSPTRSRLLSRPFMGKKSSTNIKKYGRKKKFPTISELCVTVMPIQKMARSYLAKVEVERRRRSIVIVQSIIRRWSVMKYRSSVMRGVVAVQALHRGHVAKAYVCRRMNAALVIAIVVQYWYEREQIYKMHKCASKIQAMIRGVSRRVSFHNVKRWVLELQSVTRMRPYRREFVREKIRRRIVLALRSATKIQSLWRGHRQRIAHREAVVKRHTSATKIQSLWRSFVCSTEYLLALFDIIIVQSVARRRLVLRRVTRARRQCAAAITIQSAVRGWCGYVAYLSKLAAITKTQAVARSWIASRQLEHLKEEKYQSEVEGATVIAAAWRRFVHLSAYKQQIKSITLFQSIVRRNSAVSTVKALRQERREACATIVQATWRAHSQMANFFLILSAVTLIQSHARMIAASRQMKRLKVEKLLREAQAVVPIQTAWRRCQLQSQFRRDVQDITMCQSIARRNLAAEQFKELRHEMRTNCATIIQATWRVHSALEQFRHAIAAVVLLQSNARVRAASRHLTQLKEEKHVREMKSVTSIQTAWRRRVCRSVYKRVIKDVALCQSVFRRVTSVAKVKALRHEKNTACATIIQATWRSHTTMKEFSHIKTSIILLQSLVRVIVASRKKKQLKVEKFLREMRAAVCIETAWRRRVCKRDYKRFVQDVILCQSVARQKTASVEMKVMMHAWRATCATTIQATWRSYSAAKHVIHLLSTVILIQSIARVFGASRLSNQLKIEKNIRETQAAIHLESVWRRFDCQKEFRRALQYVTVCQSVARSNAAIAKVTAMRHERNKSCALIIQVAWRAHVAHRETRGATDIQKTWRKCSCQWRYRQIVYDVIVCQSLARRAHARRIFDVMLIREECAMIIQLYWEVYFTQKSFIGIAERMEGLGMFEVTAANKISAAWRGFAMCRRFLLFVEEVTFCQSIARRWLAGRKVENKKRNRYAAAATVIQAKMRSYATIKNYPQADFRIKQIQSLTRSSIHSNRRKRDEESATLIATTWRRLYHTERYAFLIKDVIICQSVVRRNHSTRFLEAIRLNRQKSCAQLIQSNWRGYAAMGRINSVKCCKRRLKQIESTLAKATIRLKTVKDITVCQSVVRRWSAKRSLALLRLEKYFAPAAVIQSRWRTFKARNFFFSTKTTISPIQSFSNITVNRRDMSATLIQAKWRSHIFANTFIKILDSIVLLQTSIRGWMATKRTEQLRVETLEREIEIATMDKIQELWSSFFWQKEYAVYMLCLIICQSTAKQLVSLEPRPFLIQSEGERCSESSLNSISLTTTASSSHGKKCQHSKSNQKIEFEVTTSQSLQRRFIASKKIERFTSPEVAATMIQTVFRRYCCIRKFLSTLSTIVRCQRLIKRLVSTRSVDVVSPVKTRREERDVKFLPPVSKCKEISDIFKFIKVRQMATTKIQKTYRNYSIRRNHALFQHYITKICCLVKRSQENDSDCTLSKCSQTLSTLSGSETSSDTLYIQQMSSDFDSKGCDEVLTKQREEAKCVVPPGISADGISNTFDFNSLRLIELGGDVRLDARQESQCCEASVFSDSVREVLFRTGIWPRHKFGDTDLNVKGSSTTPLNPKASVNSNTVNLGKVATHKHERAKGVDAERKILDESLPHGDEKILVKSLPAPANLDTVSTLEHEGVQFVPADEKIMDKSLSAIVEIGTRNEPTDDSKESEPSALSQTRKKFIASKIFVETISAVLKIKRRQIDANLPKQTGLPHVKIAKILLGKRCNFRRQRSITRMRQDFSTARRDVMRCLRASRRMISDRYAEELDKKSHWKIVQQVEDN